MKKVQVVKALPKWKGGYLAGGHTCEIVKDELDGNYYIAIHMLFGKSLYGPYQTADEAEEAMKAFSAETEESKGVPGPKPPAPGYECGGKRGGSR